MHSPEFRIKLGGHLSPLLRLALGLTALSALGIHQVVATPARLLDPGRATLGPALCPSGTLPDGEVCLPLLGVDSDEGSALVAERNAHRTRAGDWTSYEQIPRRPERPKDYRAYRYPVAVPPEQNLVMSGYDLDRADTEQRRGSALKAVGHGGIDLAGKRGAEIHQVFLEHQEGDAEVLLVGELFGHSVVTRHRVREAGTLREYLLIHGHLDAPAAGLRAGDQLPEGSLLGFMGDSDSPGVVHLHLEVRQIREGIEPRSLAPGELVRNARTIVCDPRNVLPLSAN